MSAATPPEPDAPPPPRWVRLLARLPWGLLYALGAAAAWLARAVLGLRTAVARDNLARCFPDWPPARVEATLARHYRALSELLVEFLKLARLSPVELGAHARLVGAEPLKAALAAGRPVMFLTAHYCNWEYVLQQLRLELGVPLIAAYKPAKSAAVERAMMGIRSRFGVRMVPGKRLLRELARLRRVPHTTAFMADQVPTTSPNRHWIEFLGRPTAFFPGPAEIARIGAYEVYYVAITRVARGRYEARFDPIAAAGEVLEPLEFTRRYAARMEQQIREGAADWMWVHRRWKLEPPAAGTGGAQAAGDDEADPLA